MGIKITAREMFGISEQSACMAAPKMIQYYCLSTDKTNCSFRGKGSALVRQHRGGFFISNLQQ